MPAEPRTALQRTLVASLERHWADEAVRAHAFFVRWGAALKLAQVDPASVAEQCFEVQEPGAGLVRIQRLVDQLAWASPQTRGQAHQGVVELVELMTLVLCERRVQKAGIRAMAYEQDGLLHLPISSQLAAALIAASWLNMAIRLSIDGSGQVVASNVLCDLPLAQFGPGEQGVQDAFGAEILAFVDHSSGGGLVPYRTYRVDAIRQTLGEGLPSADYVANVLAMHREDGGLDPVFGLSAQQHLAVDAAAAAKVKDRFDIVTFLWGTASGAEDDASFQGLKGDLLRSVDKIVGRIHAAEVTQRADAASSPRKVFVSYSHADKEPWLDLVKSHLNVLTQNRFAELWVDTEIDTGDLWREKIEQALQTCSVGVLLVSVSFLNSVFIEKSELPQLLERSRRAGVLLYPILVRPCAFQMHPVLEQLQVRMKGGKKALAELGPAECERELTDIVNELHTLMSRQPGPTS